MKYNIRLLKADIMDELDKLSRIEKEIETAQKIVELPQDEVAHYDRGAIGYLLHNFYNGCENIFKAIGRFFENDMGPQTWHKDLLKRMKLEVPGFRPRVVDDHLYAQLDEFRAFRHKFRHSYSFELDWEREKLLLRKYPDTMKSLKRQVLTVFHQLEVLEKEDP